MLLKLTEKQMSELYLETEQRIMCEVEESCGHFNERRCFDRESKDNGWMMFSRYMISMSTVGKKI